MSESHKPHISEHKNEEKSLLVMLATKSDLREFCEDPTQVPIVLMCKDKVLVSNDIDRKSVV